MKNKDSSNTANKDDSKSPVLQGCCSSTSRSEGMRNNFAKQNRRAYAQMTIKITAPTNADTLYAVWTKALHADVRTSQTSCISRIQAPIARCLPINP